MDEEYQVGSERPTSPFADSPYETAYNPQSRMEKKPKKSHKKLWAALSVIALVLLCCVVTAVCVSQYWNVRFETFSNVVDNKLKVQQEQMEAALSSLAGGVSGEVAPGAPGLVYAQNVKAVVAISNQALTTNIFGQTSETASSGSGFIISEDGYVVSNYHVVEGATTLSVITYDSKEYSAKVVGYDARNDLAVLKIDATELPCVKLGSSDSLAVGDMVAAIGNPLGELTSTLTVGYVSAKDRMVNTDGTYLNMLQTDAAINSGNSGGPLFNMQGEVVGITTAKLTGTSGSGATIESIGFAIPMDDVVGMIEDLVNKGYISGAYLGVQVQDVNPEIAEAYGFPTGAYVKSVEKGSAAERAGLQAKDIIVNVGGYDVTTMSELTRVLRKFEPGQTSTITIYRSGAKVDMEITFDDKPKETQQPEQQPQENQQEQQQQIPGFGGFEDWFGSFFPGFGG